MNFHYFELTGNRGLAKASPLGPVWGIGPRVDNLRANGPHK